MMFSIATILLAAASVVSAEEFNVVVGKAADGSAAVCAMFRRKSPANQLISFLH